MTRPDATPVLGPLAKRAMRMDVGGAKRRKVIVLLAAYADAGVFDPSIRELRNRAGLETRQTIQLLRVLEQDGWISVRWAKPRSGERNHYELRNLDGR